MKIKSFLFDREMAKKAVTIVLPSILAAMDSGIVKRKDLSICILDPELKIDFQAGIEAGG